MNVKFLVLLLVLFFILIRLCVIRLLQVFSFKVIISSDTISLNPEFVFENGISIMSSIHVLVTFGNRDNEINIEMVDDIDNEAESHSIGGVLEIGKLDIHCSKFNSPSNL